MSDLRVVVGGQQKHSNLARNWELGVGVAGIGAKAESGAGAGALAHALCALFAN